MRKSERLAALAGRLPLLWVSLAFACGVLLASRVQFSTPAWLTLAGAAALAGAILQVLAARGRVPALTGLVAFSIVSLLLGAARYQAAIPKINAHHIAWYTDRQYQLYVTGWLAELPDQRDTYTNLRLHVTAVDTGDGDLPAGGLLLARVDPGRDFHYGEVIRLRGYVTTPAESEEFSYRDYLARQGIHATMTDVTAISLQMQQGNPVMAAVYWVKERAVENVYRIFPDPEASLLAGILLGMDAGLAPDLQQAFQDTGTTHIIAISGFNIAIIAGLLVTVFSRLLGPRRGALAAVVGIAAYTLLVGADPSVLRAALMGGLGLFARQVGRRQTALITLSFTAAVMTAINPHTLWDAGFQLSFAATLGLVLYAGPFQDWATARLARFTAQSNAQRLARLFSEYILFTLAAQVTTLPVIAYHFKRISLVSLVANPFILPAQPPVMVLGGLALLLSLVSLPVGQLTAYLALPFPVYTIRVVELFARLPQGSLVLGDFSPWFGVLFYGLLGTVTFASPGLKQRLRSVLSPAAILATLGILVILVWRAVFTLPDDRLHLTFLDVGSGNAILIQTPTGRNILVNGGPSTARLADALGRRLSPFDRSLDYLVLASTQEQDVASLPRTVERFPPQAILWAGRVEASYPSRQLDRWIAAEGLPVTYALPGRGLDLGAGARLEVLAVSSRGAVLLVEWEGFRALLPIGVNFNTLEVLEYGQAIGPVNLLLLASSGLAPINPPEWIDSLHPQVIILSVAAGDAFGLPSEETLAAAEGYTLLRTDRNGWIDVATDGAQLWVQVERR
ncbi:MAG: ComEC/Rec2 family competence protein [Chloroflexota bacterium]